MPANLTHQYKEAERRYRQATGPEEQAAALAEMLAVIPKHKGTDKLQADLKKRLAALRKAKAKPTGTSRQRPIYVIDIDGAGQVPVLGGPNAGKSALIAAVTNAPVQVAEYPYTTQSPLPAMMPYKDTQVQLVDTPPASAEFAPPWLAELVRRADAVIVVADPTDPDGWAAPEFVVEELAAHGIELVAARLAELHGGDTGATEGTDSAIGDDGDATGMLHVPPASETDDDADDEMLTFRVPALFVCTKADLPGAQAGRDDIVEAFGGRFPILSVSCNDPGSCEAVRRAAFDALEMIRVYSKEPGKHIKRERPWLLHDGSTVHDLANAIHHDLASGFRYGRLWGSARFEGQRVGDDYVLVDGDVVEIHAS